MTDEQTNDRLLTISEVADYCKVAELTVRRWVRTGQLRGTRMGPRFLRVKRQDLDQFLDSQSPLTVMRRAAGQAGGRSGDAQARVARLAEGRDRWQKEQALARAQSDHPEATITKAEWVAFKVTDEEAVA